MTAHHTGTVHRGGRFTLIELSCEDCGAIPDEGDVRHFVTDEVTAEEKGAGVPLILCNECYDYYATNVLPHLKESGE